jgi:transposase
MMKSKRRNFSAEMKARIALEAIKNQRTIQEIASHYGVHPNQVTRWKQQAIEGVSETFRDERSRAGESDDLLKAELYRHLSIKLCAMSDSPGLLEASLKEGIELRKHGGKGARHVSPATVLEGRDGQAELEL